ncbi:MAG TPA: SdrD B-like domain-containing protein [Verrucomicrobiota bacterium]|nr:SdrD B-like domain-containing protein [Verrucomicrobiota bacterium]
MKSLRWFALGLLTLTWAAEFSVLGQGSIYFANSSPGLVYAPILESGTNVTSEAFRIQLFAGPTTSSMAAMEPSTTVLKNGVFKGARVDVPTVPEGGIAYVQIRVWEMAGGATYEEARAAGFRTGASAVLTVKTGGDHLSPPAVPASLVGLQSFSLARGQAPMITEEPQNRTLNVGETLTLSVGASGTGVLTYQWYREGSALGGATGSSFTQPNVQPAHAGGYTVVVSNDYGSTTSRVAQVAVLVPPSILAGPYDLTFWAGSTVTNGVVAAGTAPLMYRWYEGLSGDVSRPVGTNWNRLWLGPGYVSTHYWVRVSNGAGSVDSRTAAITINRKAQTITFNPVGTLRFGQSAVTLAATASSGLAVTFEVVSGPGTLSGNRLQVTGVGTLRLRANQAGDSVWLPASAEQTVEVSKGLATVVLSGLTQVYDGTGKSVTVATVPSGLTVEVAYGGGTELPVNAGSYAVAATVVEANWEGSAAGALTIEKAPQVVTFEPLGSARYGDGPVALTASASSGLAVSFEVVRGAGVLRDGQVEIRGGGSIVVRASQGGNENWAAAAPVEQTLEIVNEHYGTVYFANRQPGFFSVPVYGEDGQTPLGPGYMAQLYAGVTVEGMEAVAVPVEFSGNGFFYGDILYLVMVPEGAVAQVEVRVWEAGGGETFEAARAGGYLHGRSGVFAVVTGGDLLSPPQFPAMLSAMASFKVARGFPPAITGEPADQVIWAGEGAVLGVEATGTEPMVYEWFEGAVGETGRPVGSGQAAWVTEPLLESRGYWVRVSNELGVAESRGCLVTVNRRAQAITFTAIGGQRYGGAPVECEASASSGLPVGFEVVSGPGALEGNELRTTGAGTIVVRAVQGGDALWLPAPPVEQTIEVARGLQSIAFGAIGSVRYSDVPLPLSASATSGLPVALAVLGGPGVIEGSGLRLTGVGFVVVQAAQPGDANWEPAAAVEQTVEVSKGLATVVLSGLTQVYDGTGKSVTVATVPSGLTVEVAYGGGTELPVNAGSYAVAATVVEANWEGSAAGALTIEKAPQVVTFEPLGSARYGDGPVALTASASSGLAVSFEVVRGAGVLRDGQVEIRGGGSIVVRASQGGNENWAAAAPVEQTLEIVNEHYGTVYFANRQPGFFSVPVYGEDGQTPLGPGYMAQLYAGVTVEGMEAVAVPVEFSGNGFFYGDILYLVMVPEGAVAQVEVRVWEAGGGETFEAARAGGYLHGRSGVFAVVTGGDLLSPPQFPAMLSAMASFKVARGFPPAITGEPADQVIWAGEGAVLGVEATGTEPMVYEWFEGAVGETGRPVGSGQAAWVTEPLLESRGYWVRVSNELGVAESRGCLVTVNRRAQAITFTAIGGQRYGGAPVECEASASSGLPVGFEVVSGPGALEGNELRTTGAGTIVVRAVQGGDALWLPAPPVEQTIEVARGLAEVALSGLAQVYDGGAKPIGVTTTPGGLGLLVTYDGQPAAPVLAGSYAVAATVVDPNWEGTAAGTLTIAKGSAGVTLVGLSQAWDGTAKSVSVTTVPAGLTVQVSYGGGQGAPAEEGSYAVAATVVDANWEGSAAGTLLIAKIVNVAGFVFNDADGDGETGEHEARIEGVSVDLVADDGETVVETAVTDENGAFEFRGIVPGAYYVDEHDLEGYVSTTAGRRAVSVPSGDMVWVTFGDQEAGVISGLVFLDLNGNGLREADEPGLGGVRITLKGGELAESTDTDAAGAYSFAGVPAGTYTVEETDPPGHTSTTPNVRTVSVGPGGSATAGFGDQAVGTIRGVVFEDLNGNGSQESGERGLEGVGVRLTGLGQEWESVSDAVGAYAFVGLAPGSYLVEETDPAGYASTTPNQRSVSLGSGGAAFGNFGDQPVGSISGVVFNDANGNEQLDAGESGLGGVLVTLLGEGVSVGARTAANGTYAFINVLAGSYFVEETDPPGFASINANRRAVTLTAGSAATATFADQAMGTVAGVVFEDTSGDGRRDAGEPGLGGVVVTLRGVGEDRVARTAGDGSYAFTTVVAGNYSVEETDPAGFTSTSPNQRAIYLASGGTATVSFGDQAMGTVSGLVFNDLNGNGARETGEAGLGGVKIVVTGSAFQAEVQTTGDGSYALSGLTPGVYVVVEVDPEGFTSTTANERTVSLASGGAATANFGDQAVGTLGGVVYEDSNGNGRRDAGEPGIGGVRIRLSQDSQELRLTTTAGDGTYGIAGLPAGAYTVEETDLPGFASTTPNTLAVTLAAGGAASASFGDLAVGQISGTVFEDRDGNGLRGDSEPGLGGVTVTLVGTQPDRSAVTSANGAYGFNDVPAGSYTVVESDPPGFVSTTANTRSVSLVAGSAATVSFGDQAAGRVGGVVFADANGNGIRDAGEAGMGGVAVALSTLAGVPVADIQTSGDGSYAFLEVAAASYTVIETDPEGFASTTPNVRTVLVAAGGSATANFGDQAMGTISGLVYNDTSGNGLRDAGEVGLGGVTVRLTGGAGVDRVMQSAGDGSYSFSGVVPGAYTVVETDPPGFTSTSPNALGVNLASGGSASAMFGDQAVGTVTGVVFEDRNGNGLQDAGESGLGGVVVALASEERTVTATTALDGSFQFADVIPGLYVATETDPLGFVSTTPNQRTLNVGSGGSASVIFGDQATGTVSGTVFDDLDGNGVQTVGEPGLGGVTVTLTAVGVNRSTQTAGDGSYSFSGVVPGAYMVTETDPPGFTSTTANRRSVVLESGSAATAAFGDQATGTVSGLVFDDQNGNGLLDPGEPGLAGVWIQLVGAVENFETVTSGTGAYAFVNMVAGSYTVVEADPEGFASTTPNEQYVSLAAAGAATALFGDQAVQTISGTVFEDLNGNGVQDAGEAGIAGVALQLIRVADEAVVAETTTSANGVFAFTQVPVGDYTIREKVPAGYTVGTGASGQVGGTGGTGLHHDPELTLDQGVTLGERGIASASFANQVVGSISGLVFNDLNGNGQFDPGEAGIGGARIRLMDPENPAAAREVLTAGNGAYQFSSVTPGHYAISQVPLSGYYVTEPEQAVELPRAGAASANFANRVGGTLSGRVFHDENGNGRQDSRERGLGGITVVVTSKLQNPQSVVTAGDGAFLFTSLALGTLTVTETDPVGFHSTTPNRVTVSMTSVGAAANFGDQSDLIQPPRIVEPPAAATVSVGDPVTLKVVATGTAPLRYQWLKNEVPIPGAIQAEYVIGSARPEDAGDYAVKVVNITGSETSASARLEVVLTDPFALWVLEHQLPTGRQGEADDADGDRLANLLEFALGTDPMADTTSSLVTAGVVSVDGQDHLVLRFPWARRATSVRACLAVSDNLRVWSEAAATFRLAGPVDADTDRAELVESAPMTQPGHQFYRLEIKPAEGP